jgi:hypothetical protein
MRHPVVVVMRHPVAVVIRHPVAVVMRHQGASHETPGGSGHETPGGSDHETPGGSSHETPGGSDNIHSVAVVMTTLISHFTLHFFFVHKITKTTISLACIAFGVNWNCVSSKRMFSKSMNSRL